MYCRNCGVTISESATRCSACDTTNGEGVNYCQNCGGHTTERTDFCRGCGAKLRTIVPKEIKVERYQYIQKQVNACKKVQGILRFCVIGSTIVTVVLVMALLFREQPDNIPNPFFTYTLEIGEDKIYQPRDYMNYADANVQEYWAQSRQLIVYIVMSFIVFTGVSLDLLIQKSKYKKLLKALKEAKDVL